MNQTSEHHNASNAAHTVTESATAATVAANGAHSERLIDRPQAAALLGVAMRTLSKLQESGRITCGRWGRNSEGHRVVLYPEAELLRLREALQREAAEDPWGPDGTGESGMLTRAQACGVLRIGRKTFADWERMGRIAACGRIKRPVGTSVDVFSAEHVERLRLEFCTHAEPAPGEAVLEREAAAAFLGIADRTFGSLVQEADCGLRTNLRIKRPDGRWIAVYAVSELERVRDARAAAAENPGGPGMIDRTRACELLRIGQKVFSDWEREGRIVAAKVVQPPVGRPMKVYALEHIQAVAAAHRPHEEPAPGEAVLEREAAAAYLGFCTGKLSDWAIAGKIPDNLRVRGEGGSWKKVYRVADLDRARREDEEAAANQFPPGITDRAGAMELLNIGCRALSVWEADGRVRCEGELKRHDGKTVKTYSIEHLEAVRAQFCTRIEVEEGPGLIGREDAAAFFGVAERTFNTWETEDRVHTDLWCRTAEGRWKKLYKVEYLEQKREEFRLAAENPIPAGLMDWEAAAALLSIGEGAFRRMERNEKIQCAGWITRPDGKRMKVYSEAEVARVREEMGERIICDHSPDLLTREEAAALFGVSAAAFSQWEKRGQISSNRWLRNPSGAPTKVYTRESLEALRELRTTGRERLAAAGLADRTAAAEFFGVSLGTICTWENEGRIHSDLWEKTPRGNPIKVYRLDYLHQRREEMRRLDAPYPDPGRPGVYRVRIRSHKYAMEALIDAESLPLVENRWWNWSGRSDGTKGDVVLSTDDNDHIPLKRIVMGVTDPAVRVSYVNGDPLDCRRSNLVVRDMSQVSRGSRKMRFQRGEECTSKFKGVTWCADREKWLAQIRKGGVHKHLGRFHDEVEAARAYDQAARRLFGIHARLNFPDAAVLGSDANSTVPASLAERIASQPTDGRAAA